MVELRIHWHGAIKDCLAPLNGMKRITRVALSPTAWCPGARPVDSTLFCATSPQFLERQDQLRARFLIKSTGSVPGQWLASYPWPLFTWRYPAYCRTEHHIAIRHSMEAQQKLYERRFDIFIGPVLPEAFRHRGVQAATRNNLPPRRKTI